MRSGEARRPVHDFRINQNHRRFHMANLGPHAKMANQMGISRSRRLCDRQVFSLAGALKFSSRQSGFDALQILRFTSPKLSAVTVNPKGISTQSPGLRGTSHPG